MTENGPQGQTKPDRAVAPQPSTPGPIYGALYRDPNDPTFVFCYLPEAEHDENPWAAWLRKSPKPWNDLRFFTKDDVNVSDLIVEYNPAAARPEPGHDSDARTWRFPVRSRTAWIEYDPDAQAVQITLAPPTYGEPHTVELNRSVLVDLDDSGEVIGIEVLLNGTSKDHNE